MHDPWTFDAISSTAYWNDDDGVDRRSLKGASDQLRPRGPRNLPVDAGEP